MYSMEKLFSNLNFPLSILTEHIRAIMNDMKMKVFKRYLKTNVIDEKQMM